MTKDIDMGPYLVIFSTIFLCWAGQEVLERKFAMSPVIVRTKDLDRTARQKHEQSATAWLRMNKRMTKSLDLGGAFRIQTRGSIFLVKTIYTFIVFICSLILFFKNNGNFFYRHFILMDDTSVYNTLYRLTISSFIGFYSWEVSANRYAKLDWSQILHHWLTCIWALILLSGRYSPFATWFGFAGVACGFPVMFAMFFRADLSHSFPSQTRKLFTFSYWWFLVEMIMNLGGQLLLIVNSLLPRNVNNNAVPLWLVIVMCFAIFIWIYDDSRLLKALKDFSTHDYERADVLSKRQRLRAGSGKAVFEMSITKNNKYGGGSEPPTDISKQVSHLEVMVGMGTNGMPRSTPETRNRNITDFDILEMPTPKTMHRTSSKLNLSTVQETTTTITIHTPPVPSPTDNVKGGYKIDNTIEKQSQVTWRD